MVVKDNGGGGGHVEGVHTGSQRNAHPTVGGPERRGREPFAFGADQEGHPGSSGDGSDVLGVGCRRQSQHLEAGGPKLAESRRPVGSPGERQPKGMSHRHPDAPAVERVGRGRVEDNPAGTEGGRIAEQGAQVLMVVHAFDHEEAVSGRGHVRELEIRDTVAGGHRPSVEVEAADRPHERLRGDVGGRVHVRQIRSQRPQPARCHQHGADGKSRVEQVADNVCALGDEEVALPATAFGLPQPQVPVGEPGEVAEPLVGGIVDGNDDGHGDESLRSRVRRPRVLPAIAVVALLATAGGLRIAVTRDRQPAPEPRPQHVILVDWDGFDPDYLGRAPMPNFDALARRGSVSLAQSTFPTLSNSARASMASGAYPERHGNVAYAYDPVSGLVHGQDRTLTAETITERLAAAGKTLACVQWYMVENRGAFAGDPEHLYVEPGGPFADRVTVAIDILNRRPVIPVTGAEPVIVPRLPDFLAVYADDLDALAHREGTTSSGMDTLLSDMDRELGRLVQATKDLGIFDVTTFLLTSDHGMTDWSQSLVPDAVAALAGTGYVSEVVGPDSSPAAETEVVLLPNAVASATVALRGRAQSDEGRRAVRQALDSLGPTLVRRVLDAGDLVSLHSASRLGDFVVEAQPPYGFALSLPFPGLSRASHGSTGELTVPLLVSGPGFGQGVRLRDPGLVDIAPTIAALLGVPAPAQAQGRALSRIAR